MARRIHDRRHSRPGLKATRPSGAGRSRPKRTPSAPAPDDAAEHDDQSTGGERLQKVLAAAGIASRRECEQFILEGRVEVDRQVVTELGTRVDSQRQEIRVDGEILPRPKLVYFAVNKPEGVVSTSRDPAGRPRVIDLLPPNTPRVFAVGRLDITSEGLILVTNDGELANGLTHPRHGVEKIYQVQVAGQVEREVFAQLNRGIHLAEGFAHVKHVRVKSRRKRSTMLELVLDEGRNREIRRLLARVGHKVQHLKRIAVGPVRLGELPTGAVRPLTKKEIDSLQRAVDSPSHSGRGTAVDSPSPLRGAPGRGSLSEKERATSDSAKLRGQKIGHRDHRGHREGRTIIGK